MPDKPNPPNWSLLPHNPVGFFELPDDFDRKALKRKYNRLIRQFKPEKFPSEFQKIRAAYELLDGQLRYGTSPARGQQNQFQWDSSPTTPNAPVTPSSDSVIQQRPPRTNEPESSPPIYQRVETESPKALFDEYRKRTGKSPFDYYAMALLADVSTNDSLMFFKLVLTGLQKHRQEAGLMNLLYEYLQQDFEAKDIPVMLSAVSKVINDQQFYFLTEKLWDQFLRQVDFKVWANALAKCESNLQDFRIEGQLAFYIHILPAAIFKGGGSWLQQKVEFLQENGQEIPEALEMDLELVNQLLEYRKSLASDTSYSLEIHAAIREYYLLGGRKGDEAIINLQHSFAQNPGLLLDNFGIDTPYNSFQISVWNFINEEVHQRYGLETNINPRKLRSKIFNLMDDLNRSEAESFGWQENIRYHWIQRGPYVIALVSPFVVLSAWFNSATFIIATLLAIAGMVAVKYYYRPDDRFINFIEKRMKQRYLFSWRGRFVHLFEATQIQHHELSDALIEIVDQHSEKVGFASWLCRYLPVDLGLHLFALATRFSR